MPAANQAPLGVTRIRSTGLPHSAGGAGISTSSIRKSPSAASGTPVMFVLNWVKGGVSSQISVANTLALPFVPMVLPPPRSRASAVDPDTPVDLHVRSEIGDHPDLTGRVDAADNVLNHVREAAVRVGGTRHVRYRNITDGSLESHQRIIGYYRRSKGSSYEDHKNTSEQTLFHNCTSIFILFHGGLATVVTSAAKGHWCDFVVPPIR